MESFPFDESMMDSKCLMSCVITQPKNLLTPQTVLLTNDSVTVIGRQAFCVFLKPPFTDFYNVILQDQMHDKLKQFFR